MMADVYNTAYLYKYVQHSVMEFAERQSVQEFTEWCMDWPVVGLVHVIKFIISDARLMLEC